MSVEELIIVAVAAMIGSTAQGCTGIGFGLMAGPVLVGIDPDFTPGPLLVPVLLISGRHIVAEWSHLDRSGLRPLLMGAPVGLVGAVVLLGTISDRALSVLVGAIVTVAAIAVLYGGGPRRTRTNMVALGAFTAFTGATAGLPGPAMTIAYHDAPPATFRSTSSLFVSMFVVVATVVLAVFGEYGGREVELTLLLVPPIIAGLIAARYLRPVIDTTIFRPAILVLAALGGLALIGRSL